MRSVFLDTATMRPEDLDLRVLTTVLPRCCFFETTTPEHVDERIIDAEIIVCNKVSLLASTMEKARNLKLICVAATGVNNIDLVAAKELGIVVCNVRNYATSSVVQHTFSLILALCGHLMAYNRAVIQGRWQTASQFCLLDYPIVELAGKTIGIVGYGNLGKSVARMAVAFDMKVCIAVRPGSQGSSPLGRVPFDALLSIVDVLSIHCPLTLDTANLIDAAALSKMKSQAILINTARGGIVDETALAVALKAGRLGGAGVDVLSIEPPTKDNPLLANDIPNLIVTPHIAWSSRDARQRLIEQIAENIRSYLNGVPRNCV